MGNNYSQQSLYITINGVRVQNLLAWDGSEEMKMSTQQAGILQGHNVASITTTSKHCLTMTARQEYCSRQLCYNGPQTGLTMHSEDPHHVWFTTVQGNSHVQLLTCHFWCFQEEGCSELSFKSFIAYIGIRTYCIDFDKPGSFYGFKFSQDTMEQQTFICATLNVSK